MKPLGACCVWLTLLVVASTPLAYSQAKIPPAPKQAPRTKKVSLETVLSCPATSFYRTIFGLTEDDFTKLSPRTKDGKLHDIDLDMERRLDVRVSWIDTSEGWLLQQISKGFKESRSDFCYSMPIVKTFFEGHPSAVTISALNFLSAETWALDPNEVFEHADQFIFTSGVFNNSTEVYLMAKKGQVEIQFVFEGGALKLYRVIYDDARLM